MPTIKLDITDDQGAFVEKMVRAGKYRNASEAMRDALRDWQQRWSEDERKEIALRKEIQIGLDALERGDYIDLNKKELADLLKKSITD